MVVSMVRSEPQQQWDRCWCCSTMTDANEREPVACSRRVLWSGCGIVAPLTAGHARVSSGVLTVVAGGLLLPWPLADFLSLCCSAAAMYDVHSIVAEPHPLM